MFDKQLPVLDLHRHLDGNVRVETVWELAHQFAMPLPAESIDKMRPLVQIQGKENDLLGFLAKLDWMVKVLGDLDAVKRVAIENVEDAARSGLDYTELRFSPYYMAETHNLPMEGVIEAVADGVRSACQSHDVQVKLIGIMSRSYGVENCTRELDAILAQRKHFTAVDLAGNEAGFPGELFVEHFKRVRDASLNVTIHAGEALGPQSIWQAIEHLGAQRIGHGVNAIQDLALMDTLAQRQIGIESCPSSNLHTSTVATIDEHPLPRFLDAGICVGLNTDDPGVSNIDIGHEYRVVREQMGLDDEAIQTLQRNGLAMAFMSDDERRQLLARKQSTN